MALADVAAPSRGLRIAAVDVARGVAIAAMIVYHFSWDLWAFGLVAADVANGPGWRLFAHAIATTFLLLVGVGLVLATRDGLNPGRYLRRLALVAGGAILVSIGTWFTDPGTFVFFGILHLIAVSSVLALPFLAAPAWVTAVAALAAIAVGNLVTAPVFESPWLVWIGLAERVPDTVDYYPLLPWFGVVLLGVVAGKVALASGVDKRLARWSPHDPVTQILALAGQWSLVIYLVHQVVLYEAVAFAAPVIAPRPPVPTVIVPDATRTFMNECLPTCSQQGKDVTTCVTYCSCMFAGLTGAGLITAVPADFTPDQRVKFDAVTKQCVGPK